jgi:hypothetical protein
MTIRIDVASRVAMTFSTNNLPEKRQEIIPAVAAAAASRRFGPQYVINFPLTFSGESNPTKGNDCPIR